MSRFLHSGDYGDVIYALPTIRALGGGSLYFCPRGDTRVPMTEERLQGIALLLKSMPYIKQVSMHAGEPIDYDFTCFRGGIIPGEPLAESQRRHVAPELSVDFSVPWLRVGPYTAQKPRSYSTPYVVFARTERYHNPEAEALYRQVPDPDLERVFVGSEGERRAMARWIVDQEPYYLRHPVTLDLCQVLEQVAGSELVVCNQSCVFALAVGLGHRAVLEVCREQPDCFYPHAGLFYYNTETDVAVIHAQIKLIK